MQKFNLYIVEYLNSLPFLKALEFFQEFDVQLSINKAIPSQCASAFYDGLADIALLPIGALQEKNHFIFSDIFGNDQRYDTGSIRGAIVSNGVVHEKVVNALKYVGVKQ